MTGNISWASNEIARWRDSRLSKRRRQSYYWRRASLRIHWLRNSIRWAILIGNRGDDFRKKLWDGGCTFHIFKSLMTPLVILLNAHPWGRLTCWTASHHYNRPSINCADVRKVVPHSLTMPVDPAPLGIHRSTKCNIISTRECKPEQEFKKSSDSIFCITLTMPRGMTRANK